ncbi:cytochrome b/b6 domain-containing protein [Hydrogenimonas thermophila]|uniref:Ni/Fe-hydrogenase 1 B-type cytochrome subunit n=1 Tax=Hydrogenimonas thermophila TaxID=223786 RepID=A0A1I5P7W9_9BACT|nr:cytochrome b/b6 domain-containing protein [Hydrogenimonas thermophila]WOE69635.1 cytochrome b/b6 domain-containing protein [Hydrogenimonas thermophila]WOE72149.1 cytochrome b/b6 domain-containing protein [Hydrogenimonas thermophila]SFP30198.1 Ni/Fe-hydrogenase 1 B-type cytochrome subunit [Hydrogenimonas thermophila]
MKPEYKRVKRMTTAGRIIHWVNAIAILTAVITGLYIAHPYYQSFISDPAVDKYVMAWNRWVHLIGAILLDVTSIIIGYLYFFSRFEKPYKKLIPTAKNIKEFFEVLINLLTLNRRKNFDSSHNDSFNTVYFTILHLLLGWMLLTGLQLYVHGLGSGTSSVGSWWPTILHLTTDWTISVTGGTLMDVRISHHLTMWWILAWVMFHIYYQVWRTIYWQEGDIAIVFGGSKFKRK